MDNLTLNTAQRISGGILVLNAITIFLMTVMGIDDGSDFSPLGAAVVDLLLGVSILRGRRRWLNLAIARVVLGMLLWGSIAYSQGDVFTIITQAIFSVSLLLLMLGSPGRFRAITGCSLASFILCLYLLTFQQHLFGHSFLNTLILNFQYGQMDSAEERVSSEQFGYSFGPLGDGWSIRDYEVMRKDNPLADCWFVNLKYDAHIVIIAEAVEEDQWVDITLFKDNVVNNGLTLMEGFEVLDEFQVGKEGFKGLGFLASASAEGMDFKYKYGLYTRRNIGIQVICFALEERYEIVAEDFNNAIDSLIIE